MAAGLEADADRSDYDLLVVSGAEPIAAYMLAKLDETLRAADIALCFAQMKDPAKDESKRLGLFARLGEETFFPTGGPAVSGYLDAHEGEWEDREHRRT